MSAYDDDPLELVRWASRLEPSARLRLIRRAAELEASEVGDLVPPNGDVVRRAGDLSPAVGDLVSPLEASHVGHRAYPAGACSPTHKDGCLRCAELELDTAEERLRVARAKVAKLKGLEP